MKAKLLVDQTPITLAGPFAVGLENPNDVIMHAGEVYDVESAGGGLVRVFFKLPWKQSRATTSLLAEEVELIDDGDADEGRPLEEIW